MQTLGQVFHDISPPVSYSIIPPWALFAGTAFILSLLGWFICYARRFFRKTKPEHSPRERAMAALGKIETAIETTAPYQFSIGVSDILRRFVLEQFNLPLTRQTSVEFLTAIASSAQFGQEDQALLADFLTRCDLIKFARYDATLDDSRSLLEEARRFVKGGALVLS